MDQASIAMRNRLATAATLFVSAAILSGAGMSQALNATSGGWLEKVWIEHSGERILLHAKLDTGAATSSINAQNYKTFQRDGRQWVRFTISGTAGHSLEIEAPVIKTARIRRAGVETRQRPAIALSICLGDQTASTLFTLADRSKLTYQILVGRSFLANRFLVDSGKTFQTPDTCYNGQRLK